MALAPDWKDVFQKVVTTARTEPAKNWYDTGGSVKDKQNQLRVKALESQQKTLQTTVSSLQKQADKLKGKKDAKSKQLLSSLNAQIKRSQAQLSALGKRLNVAYENAGMYNKLLTGANRDAFLALETVFKSYGLESLAGKIYDYVKNGYSSDTISILLQDTPEYKQRFAANEKRIKEGLPVLSPADYINTENAYRQLLRQSGLPEGFYDSNSDFTNWIAADVSPTEIQSRVDLATQATALANPYYKQALNQLGVDDGHLAAYFLDTNKALPLLQKAAATAAIGSAALQQGLTFDKTFAEQLATSGISAEQAQQGYSQVAQELGTLSNLGNIYGQTWTQSESEQSIFGTSPGATAKKAGLVGQERGAFGGAAGGGRAGLGQSQSQQ